MEYMKPLQHVKALQPGFSWQNDEDDAHSGFSSLFFFCTIYSSAGARISAVLGVSPLTTEELNASGHNEQHKPDLEQIFAGSILLQPQNTTEQHVPKTGNQEFVYVRKRKLNIQNSSPSAAASVITDASPDTQNENGDGDASVRKVRRTSDREPEKHKISIHGDSDDTEVHVRKPRPTKTRESENCEMNDGDEDGDGDGDGDENFQEGKERRSKERKLVQKDKINNDAVALISPASVGNLVSARERVRTARMIYDGLRRKFLQERVARSDLIAGSEMKDRGLFLNRGANIVGSVPGVNIGDVFFYRMELTVMGLHTQIMAGIDYIKAKHSPWEEQVAVCIISSGYYEDNEDDGGDTIIYTGQGGKNFQTEGKHFGHQELTRGNLALDKSMYHEVEVRVIRGISNVPGPSGKIYVYDGLYRVQKAWYDRGKSGFGVFRFELERVPDQPPLGSWVLKRCNQWIKDPSSRENLLNLDVSGGKESVPVCGTNDADGAVLEEFEYCNKVKYSSTAMGMLKAASGCDCSNGGCGDRKCACVGRNGGQIAYNADGSLVRTKNVIFECGSQCKCAENCSNRVAQHGLKRHLEVFRTSDKRWAVRSWEPIPAGSFVCEYTGEVFTESEWVDEEENRGNQYLLYVDHTMEQKQINFDSLYDVFELGRQVAAPSIKFDIVVNAGKMGNVSRFMNHSCSPNLVRQCVLYDHHDNSFPHIMLFSIENIPPMVELTFDHGK